MPTDPALRAMRELPEVEKLARTFAEEYLTGHYRPLREDERKRYEQLVVVMLAFVAAAQRELAAVPPVQDPPAAPDPLTPKQLRQQKCSHQYWDLGYCIDCGIHSNDPLYQEQLRARAVAVRPSRREPSDLPTTTTKRERYLARRQCPPELTTALVNARLEVNDWHACATPDELARWRAAQQRLIDAAEAVGQASVKAWADLVALLPPETGQP